MANPSSLPRLLAVLCWRKTAYSAAWRHSIVSQGRTTMIGIVVWLATALWWAWMLPRVAAYRTVVAACGRASVVQVS
jgi:hypothetical protein